MTLKTTCWFRNSRVENLNKIRNLIKILRKCGDLESLKQFCLVKIEKKVWMDLFKQNWEESLGV
jgi:hypothetical protein